MSRHDKFPLCKSAAKSSMGRQYAALPFRRVEDEILIALVTSRETGRWVLPKGWAEKHLSGSALAAKEAYEEAGIVGEISGKAIGSYHYAKQLPTGANLLCAVKVFPLRMTLLLDQWPERDQRRREWFTLGQAALRVDEPELMTLLLKLGTAAA